MARYAIGDVQGCGDELSELITRVGFNPAHDRLWFVGDLVNRGPKSLEVLRAVRALGAAAVVVLGNHDLHLLAVAEGLARKRADDTLDDVLEAPDRDALLTWLRARPLMHVEGQWAMVHAGLLPEWTVPRAQALAAEVERVLRGPGYREFLAHMYGSTPLAWNDGLEGWDRLRVIVNAMTRIRFMSGAGHMELKHKGVAPPPGFAAWYDARPPRDEPALVCGHWSTLGLKIDPRVAMIDTGCVWGGALTALRLEDRWLAQVSCRGYQPVGEAV
ncbi:MAG: bis(5'-nucleosyl)-tetraphosphatase (symmetrical) [Betaproteobacteria bacterium RIFCSPLOWO2_02_FULL_67_19]|nr:MAG: bis(5'-nucleosyl)-tetraphosphatase (symmetrical) [Betaproteobacteria bacterium RIFCSPLOWO2_02_FULL_67_19]